MGSPHARYAFATLTESGWIAECRAVAYDWDTASAIAQQNGRPDWATALRSGYC